MYTCDTEVVESYVRKTDRKDERFVYFLQEHQIDLVINTTDRIFSDPLQTYNFKTSSRLRNEGLNDKNEIMDNIVEQIRTCNRYIHYYWEHERSVLLVCDMGLESSLIASYFIG
eukprot:UN25319